jgi:hypothetical protein
MAPKRSASTSPEPSTAPSDVGSVSSSDGERLPAQQTTRSGRTSRRAACAGDGSTMVTGTNNTKTHVPQS